MLIRPNIKPSEVKISIPVAVIMHVIKQYNKSEELYPIVFLLRPLLSSSQSESTNKTTVTEITALAFSDVEQATLSDFSNAKIQVEGQFILSGSKLTQLLPTFGTSDTASEDVSECSVCLSNPKDVVFIPCRHVAVCRECNNMVTKCPLCRLNVRSYTVIHSPNPSGS